MDRTNPPSVTGVDEKKYLDIFADKLIETFKTEMQILRDEVDVKLTHVEAKMRNDESVSSEEIFGMETPYQPNRRSTMFGIEKKVLSRIIQEQ